MVWLVVVLDLVPAEGRYSQPLELTLRVHGEPEALDGWLARARGVTAAIFGSLQVTVRWITCIGSATGNPACSRPPAPLEFVVRVRDRDDPARQGCGRSNRPLVGRGHYVTVFGDCVASSATALGVPPEVVGGHVIAHEIGHLLLPVGHGPVGVMRRLLDRNDWNAAVNGALNFTSAEAGLIRDGLLQRAAAVRD